MRMQNIFFCLGASCWSGHFTRSIFLFFLTRQFPGARSILFFSLCLLPLRWTACARQTFFFWLCMQKLCYFSPVLSLSCGACSSLFFFACCRSAGQQDSLCAPDFFIFYFFFLSLHARAEYFFSVASCLRATFSVWSAGVCMQIFFGCACRVRSLLLCWALPSFFLDTSALFGHFSQPSKRVRAPCIFFFLPPSTAVCAAFLFL